MKSHDYLQTSSYTVWEFLKSGKKLEEVCEDLPEELVGWIVALSTVILMNKVFLDATAKEEFRMAMWYTNSLYDLDASEYDRRKAFAFKASQSTAPGLLFLLYDGKISTYEKRLWEEVKPKFSRFSKVEEE